MSNTQQRNEITRHHAEAVRTGTRLSFFKPLQESLFAGDDAGPLFAAAPAPVEAAQEALKNHLRGAIVREHFAALAAAPAPIIEESFDTKWARAAGELTAAYRGNRGKGAK